MKLEKYSLWDHGNVQGLLSIRRLPSSLINTLPETGYVMLDDKILVAAGFLRKVEGGFGMLDGYITNPACSSEQRHAALDGITSKLILVAKQICPSGIFIHTSNKGIISRAENFGFKVIADEMLTLGGSEWAF